MPARIWLNTALSCAPEVWLDWEAIATMGWIRVWEDERYNTS